MWPAIISALAALGSSIANVVSTKKTNKSNKEIAQMNNQFNEGMFEKQIAYEQEMFDKENEYNTPANQVARLQSAGLNPVWSSQAIAQGQASASGGAVSPPSAQPVTMQAPQFDFSGISNTMTNFFNPEQMKAKAEGTQVYQESQYRVQKLIAEAMATRNKGLLDSAMGDYYKIKGINETSMTNSNIALNNEKMLVQRAQAKLIGEQATLAMKDIASYDQRTQSTIADAWSRVTFNNAAAGKSYQDAKESQARTLKITAETEGLNIELDKIAYHYDEYIKNFAYELSGKRYESAEKAWRVIQTKNNSHGGVWQTLQEIQYRMPWMKEGTKGDFDANIPYPDKDRRGRTQ